MTAATPISVVITNYNGLGNLREHLPSVLEAFRQIPDYEVVIADDASTDASVEYLRREFPRVRVVVHERNEGFPVTANTGFEAARHPYVFLLSSDMVPAPQCVERMVRLLESADDVLCVGGIQVYPDGTLLCGRFRGFVRRGSLRVRPHEEQPTTNDGRIFHQFQNAIGLYRRDHFMAIGGFCELFAPFYFEEVDLSYRAWKLGYRILYEPEAKVVHYVEHSSIRAAYGRRARKAHHRIHQYYLFWKNVDQTRWLAVHAAWLTGRLAISWLWADWPLYRACLGRLRLRASFAEKRRFVLENAQLSDDEVLDVSARTLPAQTGGLANRTG